MHTRIHQTDQLSHPQRESFKSHKIKRPPCLVMPPAQLIDRPLGLFSRNTSFWAWSTNSYLLLFISCAATVCCCCAAAVLLPAVSHVLSTHHDYRTRIDCPRRIGPLRYHTYHMMCSQQNKKVHTHNPPHHYIPPSRGRVKSEPTFVRVNRHIPYHRSVHVLY